MVQCGETWIPGPDQGKFAFQRLLGSMYFLLHGHLNTYFSNCLLRSVPFRLMTWPRYFSRSCHKSRWWLKFANVYNLQVSHYLTLLCISRSLYLHSSLCEVIFPSQFSWTCSRPRLIRPQSFSCTAARRSSSCTAWYQTRGIIWLFSSVGRASGPAPVSLSTLR